MANRTNIIEILKIAEKYNPTGYCCAEHDVLYVINSVYGIDISDEDQKRLEELGAHYDEEQDSWAIFT